MFAAQESIRLGAEIDLDQFHSSLIEEPPADAAHGTPDQSPDQSDTSVSIG